MHLDQGVTRSWLARHLMARESRDDQLRLRFPYLVQVFEAIDGWCWTVLPSGKQVQKPPPPSPYEGASISARWSLSWPSLRPADSELQGTCWSVADTASQTSFGTRFHNAAWHCVIDLIALSTVGVLSGLGTRTPLRTRRLLYLEQRQ